MTYKGSWQRPTSVSREEADLRYELIFNCKTEERKAEIKKRIAELEAERYGRKDEDQND